MFSQIVSGIYLFISYNFNLSTEIPHLLDSIVHFFNKAFNVLIIVIPKSYLIVSTSGPSLNLVLLITFSLDGRMMCLAFLCIL